MRQKLRNKIPADYTLVDIYNELQKEYTLKTKFYEVNKAMFMEICKEFNDRLMREHVLAGPLGARLPFNLGHMRIKKVKPKPGVYSIDHNLSKQYKKEIVHFNEHTQGMICKFLWETKGIRITGKSRYSWQACRKHTRQLAQILKNPDREIDYFE